MRSWSVYIGRFLGVEFRIHFVFFFLLLFILLLPSPHAGDLDTVVRGVELTLFILISVFLHELGHALAALRGGRPMRGSMLLPIGGIAAADPNPQLEVTSSLARQVRIAMAGPVVNLFLACASGTALLLQGPSVNLWSFPLVTVDSLGKSFFWINLCLFAINLLPAFPLDGGRILRVLLARRMDYRQASRRAVILGNLFAGAFMLASLETQWMMLIGLVLFLATQMEERTVLFHSVAESVLMEDVMLTEFSTLSPADTLEDALSKAVHSLQDDFPVVSGADLVGVINKQVIVEHLRREGNGYIQGAMNKAFETAGRNESLASAFRKLSTRGLTLIPVLDEDRLVGIVTLQNLMHSMGLLAEARRLRRRMEE
jgi:Zn-dependent protease